MPRVTHFEIDAEKPEELTKFYKKVFGWKIVKWEGPIDYWLITTGEEDEPGIDGARLPSAHQTSTIARAILDFV